MTIIIASILLACAPSFGGEVDVSGDWTPLPGFGAAMVDGVRAACWHQGELYAVGSAVTPATESTRRRSHVAVIVHRSGRWQKVRDLESRNDWQLASSGRDLYATQDGNVHRLRDGEWQEFTGGLRVQARQAACWDGKLVVQGHLKTEKGSARPQVASWDGASWQQLGEGFGGVPVPVVNCIAAGPDGLWAAGNFRRIDNKPAGCIARWDGTEWDPVGDGADGAISALSSWADGVAIAGIFTRAGGVPCPGLAAWSAVGWRALPELPQQAPPHPSVLACPVPTVTRLVDIGGPLLAMGRFTFVDDRGDTARDAALLVDGRWRRWEPAGQVLPRAHLTEARWWDVGRGLHDVVDVVADGERITLIWRDVEGRSLIAVVDGHVTWPLCPRVVVPGGFLRPASWMDELLLLGPEYIGEQRFGGLARLEPAGWEPVGDWLGASGASGGWVQSAVEWRGQLAVSGMFESVADHAAPGVAVFDGEHWRPLAGGAAPDSLGMTRLLPRRSDLILCGTSPSGWSSSRRTFWRWDGNAWMRLATPENMSIWGASTDNMAAAGDTLWVLSGLVNPDKRLAHFSLGTALFALVDTTWSQLSSTVPAGIQNLAYWNGALHAATSKWDESRTRLLRWNGHDWTRAGAPDLSSEQSHGALMPLADGTCLLPGRGQSLCWDGADEWAVWPGSGPGLYSAMTLAGGRLFKVTGDGAPDARVWTGALPPLDAHTRPAVPEVAARRPACVIDRRDLPSLAMCADGDTNCGWRFLDPGGDPHPAKVSARGTRGLQMSRGSGTLVHRFHSKAPMWFRLTAQLSGYSRLRPPSIAVHTRDQKRLHGSTLHVDFKRRGESVPAKLGMDLLIATTEDRFLGHLSLEGGDLGVRMDKLKLEARTSLFSEALEEMWRAVLAMRRPDAADTTEIAAAPSPGILDAASHTFGNVGADSLAMRMIADLGDKRLWVRGSPKWHNDPEDGTESPVWGKHRPHSALSTGIQCERLPVAVDDWLPGDVAYTCVFDPENPRYFRAVGSGLGMPRANDLQASGLILDLREADPVREVRVGLVGEALRSLGVGRLRWMRVRDTSGKTRPWLELGPPDHGKFDPWPRVADLPIIVLVSRYTNGAHALLAEALSRLDNVTLIGEPTAPLPAWDDGIPAPWGEWSLMVPAGVWEGPDGHTLTDTSVAPDVAWSAADTDGLIEQAHAVVSRFHRPGPVPPTPPSASAAPRRTSRRP